MKRFIVLTFFFLGWAFYEMSGGSDFRPPEPPVTIAQAPDPASADEITARPVIANLRPEPAKRQRPDDPARANALRASLETAPAIFSDPLDDFDAGDSVQLAALESRDLALGSPDPDEPQQRPSDIRQVIGTHVNMRQGPGTTYPVIARMNLGDEVEVLSDPGNGWLRLRDLRDRRMGWIAASLIGKGG